MDSTPKMKAVARDYAPEPFYLVQHDDKHGDRLVAYTCDLEELKRAVYGLLSSYGLQIRVLMKILRSVQETEQKWTRYSADFQRDHLLALLQAHEKFVFSHGFHVLCCKEIETGAYFAIDEHDILFCYGDMGRYQIFFAGLGFSHRIETLASEVMHWHIVPKDSEKLQADFIGALGLVEVHQD